MHLIDVAELITCKKARRSGKTVTCMTNGGAPGGGEGREDSFWSPLPAPNSTFCDSGENCPLPTNTVTSSWRDITCFEQQISPSLCGVIGPEAKLCSPITGWRWCLTLSATVLQMDFLLYINCLKADRTKLQKPSVRDQALHHICAYCLPQIFLFSIALLLGVGLSFLNLIQSR
jgi:hypothetical protein